MITLITKVCGLVTNYERIKRWRTNNPEAYKKSRSKYAKKRYEKVKQLIWSLKSKPCMDCGISYHPWQMDFDHRNKATKILAIGGFHWGNVQIVTGIELTKGYGREHEI